MKGMGNTITTRVMVMTIIMSIWCRWREVS